MRTPVPRSLNCCTSAVLGALFFLLGSAAPTKAGILTITGGSTVPPNTFHGETGASIPDGVAGYVGGTLVVGAADFYTFTYGGGGLLPGDTGRGDTTYSNEFWLGSTEAAAIGAGHVFCTFALAACGGTASTVGSSFTIFLSPGVIPFGFRFGPTSSDILMTGEQNANIGAYLAQIGLSTTPFAGPGYTAYLGLADRPYPADDDFQDMVITVSTVPEPSSALILGGGLIVFGLLGRRRRAG